MGSDHKASVSESGRAKPASAPQGSKESRRLQDLVNRRVEATFQEGGGQADLDEFLPTSSHSPKQPIVTKVIPVAATENVQVTASPLQSELGNIQDIKIDQIFPSPFQPRQQMNEAADLELADSVKESGLLQPVIVRALPDGRYELVAGERRQVTHAGRALHTGTGDIEEAGTEPDGDGEPGGTCGQFRLGVA